MKKDDAKRNKGSFTSFILQGPTGAGKTKRAKEIAQQLGQDVIRLDMADYPSIDVSKLMGSPPGYAEFKETLAARFAGKAGVVVVDEVEKGSPATAEAALRQLDGAKITTNVKKRRDPGTKP